ncbi:MAG: hypothetical protein ACXWFO_09895 [Candidatus Aminicenantales bacterium]
MPGRATAGLSRRIFSGPAQVFISDNLVVGIPAEEIMATDREVPDTGIEISNPSPPFWAISCRLSVPITQVYCLAVRFAPSRDRLSVL